MLEIKTIPILNRNKNPNNTRIINPNLAISVFDWRNSFPASTALVDENSFIELWMEFFVSAIVLEKLLNVFEIPFVTASAFGRIFAIGCCSGF